MTDSPRLAVALRLHQAWREDNDFWDGAALYLDEDTAKSHAARDYLGYEYGCSGDCDDEGTEEHASLPALTWEQAHGSWHLLADGTETLVRISLAPRCPSSWSKPLAPAPLITQRPPPRRSTSAMTDLAVVEPGSIVLEPEMEATYFGIPVVYYGEDGDMLALGHHSPRRALAAFNAHARSIGLRNVADDRDAEAEYWLADSRAKWFVFTRPNPDEGDDPDFIWYAIPGEAGSPNAVPVMHLAPAA